MRRRLQPRAQLGFLAVLREGDAVHRADIDAGVALDAELPGEHGLHVAVQAALRLLEGELVVVAELDLGADVLQRDDVVARRHAVALIERDVVVVGPFVDAHLLADDFHGGQGTVVDVLAREELVDRDRGLVAVRHRPDDVLRAERRIAAEEDLRIGRREGLRIDLRHVPLVELEPDVALDPGERVLLADRDEHVVAFEMLVRLAGRHQLAAALGVVLGLHLLEGDAGELAVVVGEFLRHEVIVDRDALVHRVFFFPRRGFHLLEAGAHDHLHVLAAEAARGAAAVHRGVAAAEHDDALADLVDVAERDRREPVDADVDVLLGLFAARNVELAPARRAGADEHRVPALGEQRLQAVDRAAAAKLDAEIEDVVALLVDHLVGEAELGDLRAHHAAGAEVAVEHDAFVAHRREIARDGERGGAGADQRDALAVALVLRDRLGQPLGDVFLVVGGDALQPADRDRLLLDAPAPAGRLAGAVAGAPENPGKHVGLPVDHVGVAVAARRDQPDVFGNGRMRGARPLAIDDLVKVVGRGNVGEFHSLLVLALQKGLSAALIFSSPRTGLWPPIPRGMLVERFQESHRYHGPNAQRTHPNLSGWLPPLRMPFIAPTAAGIKQWIHG